MTWN
jgi:DNA-binding HxlR family transcriptional regulator